LLYGKVVGKNLTLLRNTLTLDVGENAEIHIGNPIISGEGLIGRVIAVSSNYCIVQIILNVDFRASAKVQRSRIDGILAWDGKSLLLRNVPKSLDVRKGDAIITSEYSNAFPPNIKLGFVISVSETPGDLFKRIEVQPTVDFVTLEEAFAMDYVPSLEKIKLEEKLQK
jgi:rod shape-determining protein MreC